MSHLREEEGREREEGGREREREKEGEGEGCELRQPCMHTVSLNDSFLVSQ